MEAVDGAVLTGLQDSSQQRAAAIATWKRRVRDSRNTHQKAELQKKLDVKERELAQLRNAIRCLRLQKLQIRGLQNIVKSGTRNKRLRGFQHVVQDGLGDIRRSESKKKETVNAARMKALHAKNKALKSEATQFKGLAKTLQSVVYGDTEGRDDSGDRGDRGGGGGGGGGGGDSGSGGGGGGRGGSGYGSGDGGGGGGGGMKSESPPQAPRDLEEASAPESKVRSFATHPRYGTPMAIPSRAVLHLPTTNGGDSGGGSGGGGGGGGGAKLSKEAKEVVDSYRGLCSGDHIPPQPNRVSNGASGGGQENGWRFAANGTLTDPFSAIEVLSALLVPFRYVAVEVYMLCVRRKRK